MRTSSSYLLGGGLLASLAAAKPMPQQLDFSQVNAAAPVANGPVADGIAQQTASLATTYAVSLPSSTAAAQKRSLLTPERRDTIGGFDAAFGSAGSLSSIAATALTWFTGGSTHNVYGNVNNQGSFYLSQTDYLKANPGAGGMTSNWNGHDTSNGNLQNFPGGLIQLNDISASGAAQFNWNLFSGSNNGTLQWCARGDFGGSIFGLTFDYDFVNYGQISFEQVGGSSGVTSWKNSGKASGNIYNYGSFHLTNSVHHVSHNIYGSGCWQLDVGATFYLEDGAGLAQNPTKGGCLPGQSITFLDSSAIMHFEAGVYSQNSNFGSKVFGFGAGNAFEFRETIRSYAYSSGSGILNVKFWSGNSVNINIGGGYDASKFFIKSHFSVYAWYGLNAIWYSGSCPGQSPPPTCSSKCNPCGNLGNNPPPPPKSACSTKPTTTSVWGKPTTTPTWTPTPTPTPTPTTTSTTSTTPAVPTTTTWLTTTAPTGPVTTTTTTSPYSPCYAALSTCTPGGTPTTSSATACPTTPEEGTYCGFINPEDPCSPQPDGYGPVPSPDTASAFLAYPPFHSMASAAPSVIPSTNGAQYTQTFRDLNASTSAQSYLGLYTLQTYDYNQCASQCDQNSLCTAFNLYIERDPSLNPAKNDTTAPTVWGTYCPNPKSMTTFKCTLWGSNIDASTATNYGEYREDFQVVITGSDGWDKTNSTTPANPTAPSTSTYTGTGTATGTATATATVTPVTTPASPPTTVTGGTTPTTVSASTSKATPTGPLQPSGPGGSCQPWGKPGNCHGKGIDGAKFWLGAYFFAGPYNPQACSDYTLSFNAAARAQAVLAGKHSYSAAQMFNAYYLHKNGQPHGTYCSLYSAGLDVSFCTYVGGRSGSDIFDIHASWTFALSIPDPGTC